ncbi:MAG: hypothetical protein ACRD20_17950 [Terriglobales bacterium]
MTLTRCMLFAWCVASVVYGLGQESTTHLPDTGRKARLTLLSPISSKSPSGSSFMAKLEDPVAVEGKPVLPQGTLVEGHLETVPARRLMRRGALRMVFDRIKLPDGTVQPARLELSSTESKSAKTDSEGTVHPTVGKKRLVLQLGGTALVAKLADDLSEEALATTAGSARWYGLAASTTFLLLQKGREVKLKAGETIEVDFLRDGPALTEGDR